MRTGYAAFLAGIGLAFLALFAAVYTVHFYSVPQVFAWTALVCGGLAGSALTAAAAELVPSHRRHPERGPGVEVHEIN